jgi:hypothetical protein
MPGNHADFQGSSRMKRCVNSAKEADQHAGPSREDFVDFPLRPSNEHFLILHISLFRGAAEAALDCAQLSHPPTHWHAETCH